MDFERRRKGRDSLVKKKKRRKREGERTAGMAGGQKQIVVFLVFRISGLNSPAAILSLLPSYCNIVNSFVHPPIQPSIHPVICPSVHPFIYLSSIHPSYNLAVHPYHHPSVCSSYLMSFLLPCLCFLSSPKPRTQGADLDCCFLVFQAQ